MRIALQHIPLGTANTGGSSTCEFSVDAEAEDGESACGHPLWRQRPGKSLLHHFSPPMAGPRLPQASSWQHDGGHQGTTPSPRGRVSRKFALNWALQVWLRTKIGAICARRRRRPVRPMAAATPDQPQASRSRSRTRSRAPDLGPFPSELPDRPPVATSRADRLALLRT